MSFISSGVEFGDLGSQPPITLRVYVSRLPRLDQHNGSLLEHFFNFLTDPGTQRSQLS